VVPGSQVQLSNAQLTGADENIAGMFGVTAPHYLGPLIVAQKDRPVRVVFRNLLPTGVKGDLFLPVDTTVMGAGPGQGGTDGSQANMGVGAQPQNPLCGLTAKPSWCYTENRATIHLHGGATPWISDGTPHQWITPAGESRDGTLTPYPQGVSVKMVPDMPVPAGGASLPGQRDGVQTFYYTNQQSARMLFYHDHAWGITRINVYAGEAAGYIIEDSTEQALVTAGTIPNAASTLPLIIEDKTFVPTTQELAVADPRGTPPSGAARAPVAAARVRAGPEPLGHRWRQPVRPMGLWPVVPPGDNRHQLPAGRESLPIAAPRSLQSEHRGLRS
jgi:FtsP/CotA-like multicopper oxidase with cupredoxin domain